MMQVKSTYLYKYQALVKKALEKPLDFRLMEVWDALEEAEKFISQLGKPPAARVHTQEKP